MAEFPDRYPGRDGRLDRAAHRGAVWRSNAQATGLADQPFSGLAAERGPQLERLQRDRREAWMFKAGDTEQPGRSVRGAEVVPDAVTFDSRDVYPARRKPPQRC